MSLLQEANILASYDGKPMGQGDVRLEVLERWRDEIWNAKNFVALTARYEELVQAARAYTNAPSSNDPHLELSRAEAVALTRIYDAVKALDTEEQK